MSTPTGILAPPIPIATRFLAAGYQLRIWSRPKELSAMRPVVEKEYVAHLSKDGCRACWGAAETPYLAMHALEIFLDCENARP